MFSSRFHFDCRSSSFEHSQVVRASLVSLITSPCLEPIRRDTSEQQRSRKKNERERRKKNDKHNWQQQKDPPQKKKQCRNGIEPFRPPPPTNLSFPRLFSAAAQYFLCLCLWVYVCTHVRYSQKPTYIPGHTLPH